MKEMENASKRGKSLRRYGRDYLLQLRMHPLSLQKPEQLPEVEIVKDRLYLHQIDNIGSPGLADPQQNFIPDRYAYLMKQETYTKNSQPRTGYLPRGCSFYNSSQKYNTTVPKYRSTYSPPYFNSCPKQHLYRATTAAYKSDISTEDFFENMADIQTAPWYKESFPVYAPENIWNLNQKVLDNKSSSSLNENVNLPKCKKKLPIIDPKTGKDILDEICETSTNSQSSVSSKENAEEETKTLSSETVTVSPEDSQNVMFMHDDVHDFAEVTAMGEELPFIPQSSKKSAGDSAALSLNQDSSDEEFLKEYERCQHSVPVSSNAESGDSEQNMYKNFDFAEVFSSKDGIFPDTHMEFNLENNFEYNDGHNPHLKNAKVTQTTPKCPNETKHPTIPLQENNENSLKEKIIMLRDKIYSMKQEQQKMAIMQSFLRFKKHQLDETFRTLDDKKIDIVNWEYNLYNKAKKLHEKEFWLDTKSKSLLNREKQLEEKEKWLEHKINEMETKYDDLLKQNKASDPNTKEGATGTESGKVGSRVQGNQSSETESAQKGIDAKDKFKDSGNVNTVQNDNSLGDVLKQAHTAEGETMKNDDKSDNVKSTIPNKKPIYSEGRKYFPENIKYSLNIKEKKTDFENKDITHKTDKIVNYKEGRKDDNSRKPSNYSSESRTPFTNTGESLKWIPSEGRKYFPENLKFHLNQKDRKVKEIAFQVETKKSSPNETSRKSKEEYDRKFKTRDGISSKPEQYLPSDNLKNQNFKYNITPSSRRQELISSEGRKYFSEPIKYYLDQKDKKINRNLPQSSGEMDTVTFEKALDKRQGRDKVFTVSSTCEESSAKFKSRKSFPSEGRKYLTEQMKFCLNQKDKMTSENSSSTNNEDGPKLEKPNNNEICDIKSVENSFPSEGRKYLTEQINYLNQKDKMANENSLSAKNEHDSSEEKPSRKEILDVKSVQIKKGSGKDNTGSEKEIKKDTKKGLDSFKKPKDYGSGDISDTKSTLSKEQTVNNEDLCSGAKSCNLDKKVSSEGRKYLPENI